MIDTAVFFLRKLGGLAFSPPVWVVVLMALALLALWLNRRRAAIGLLGAGLVLALAVAVVPAGTWLVHPLESRHPVAPALARVDGIVLLGGSEDLGVSAARGVPELNAAGDRLVAAAILARRFPQARVVVTGGSGRVADALRGGPALSEASVARDLLVALGVAPERLLVEDGARNTLENARRALDALGPEAAPDGAAVWVLVTSAFHMPRALASFERAGWTGLVPWPVDFRTATDRPAWGWRPYANAAMLETGLRETLGRWIAR